MKKNIAVYPGTFDPITKGHLDLISRASSLFDTIIVAIADNQKKAPLFSLTERIELAQDALQQYNNVQVKGFNKLLMEFAKEHQANIVLRGLRAVSDFDYEFQLAGVNRLIDNRIETIFLTPNEHYTYISSSFVREIASLGGSVDSFVPKNVAQALRARFSSEKKSS